MFARLHKWTERFGPGVVTGASDDDPSGIATYSQAGAVGGFAFLWTCLYTIPLLIVVQEMCARIALVTGKGLLANMLARHSRRLVGCMVILLVVANTINLGADIGMMAASAKLLVPVPTWSLLIVFTVITIWLQVWVKYPVFAKYLKWLTLSLLAYVLVGGIISVPWSQATLATILPSFAWKKDYWLMIVALLGTTVSPYLYFWQADQVIEEEMEHHHMSKQHPRETESVLKRSLPRMRVDVVVGMILSNLVAWFIIMTAGAVLHTHGILDITSADQAARVLEPLAGRWASMLFAVGIIGTGLLAVPILSGSAAYALNEFFGLDGSLSKTWKQSQTFYEMIIVITVLGVLMNVFRINPVQALIWAAVCNAIIAAPMLYFILNMGSDKTIMGHHINSRLSNIVGWFTFACMAGSALLWVIFSVFVK